MLKSLVKGRVRRHWVTSGGLYLPATKWKHNDVLYDWATIVGTLLSQGTRAYRLSTMYIEFENVADPGDPVSIPTIGRDEGISYYDGLSGSLVRDYLRVSVAAVSLTSTDDDNFPGGNLLTFFAQTQGVTGVNGKTFSNGANSKIFGGALVSAPDEADATQDLVFSRFYLDEEDQDVKPVSAQTGLEWQIELG